MSSALIWEIVKSNNAYLVKRNGVTFSRDPSNLTNTGTFSASGLAHKNAVAVTPAGVTLKTKKGFTALPLNRAGRNSNKAVAAVLKSYRADRIRPAQARNSQLNKAAKRQTVAPEAKKGRRVFKRA